MDVYGGVIFWVLESVVMDDFTDIGQERGGHVF